MSCLLLELVALNFALRETVLVPSLILINFIMAYIFVWTISHVYEDSRVKGVDRLNSLAHQDALTGAQNRLSLITAFNQSSKQFEGFYLFTLDIDDFKAINDSYGHAAGDEVLRQVVLRLGRVVGTQHIYRMGGEEFVVVLTRQLVNENGLPELVGKLQDCVMDTPITFQSTQIRVTFSAGLEKFTRQEGLDRTLSKADNGLYLAKKAGKKCSFYQGEALV
nr:GGDEF domain-containing protein [Vibrio brasiliensis]